jgi:riboflavin kinase/FMN adenylyltransferase
MVHATWEELTEGRMAAQGPASAAIGTFDGLHRGHAELLRRLAGPGIHSEVVVTFRNHPRNVLTGRVSGRLMTGRQKERRLQAAGATHLVVIDFSEAFSKIAGEDFLAALQRSLPLARLVVGSDFRCGRGRDTDVAAMRKQLAPLGVTVDAVPPIQHNGVPVSSSRIRQAISVADFETATELLGHPYEIEIDGGGASAWSASKNGGIPAAGEYKLSVARDAIGQLLPEPGNYRGFTVDRAGKLPLTIRVSDTAVALLSRERLDTQQGHTIEFVAFDRSLSGDVAQRHVARAT